MRQTDPRLQLIREISFIETAHTCATAVAIHTLLKDARLTFPQGICRLTPSYKPHFVLYLVLNTFKQPRCLISASFCLHILNFVGFIQLGYKVALHVPTHKQGVSIFPESHVLSR